MAFKAAANKALRGKKKGMVPTTRGSLRQICSEKVLLPG